MAHIAGIPRICVKCYVTIRQVINAYLLERIQDIATTSMTKTVGLPVHSLLGDGLVLEFSKSGFEAVVRDLATQALGSKVRFQKDVFNQLQLEVETHVLYILKRAKIIMDHSNRRVVYPKDVMFVVNEILPMSQST